MAIPHPRAAFRHRDFRLFVASRFLALVAYQMLIIAVSQSVYEMTGDPFDLGLIGLTLFAPKILFTLFAGQVTDRFDRRKILLISRLLHLIVIGGLILFFYLNHHGDLLILYPLLFLMGTVGTFGAPASQVFLTEIVPEADFGNAVTWSSSSMQIAFVVGPALGGALYAMSGSALFVLLVVGILWAISTTLLYPIHPPRTGSAPAGIEETQISWKGLLAGLHYVFRTRIILGSISMDLFAVLLGGAVALLPIYANEILKVGPTGLGILRAAPALGAALMSIALAHVPLKRSGLTMLWSVGIFGAATILFGLSRNFSFSLVCLTLLGAADIVSVVVRGILVQVETPPQMRGRVSAINLVFIGASNELGEFESGLTAGWFGTVPAVVLGGVGTILVALLWNWRFPEIRRYHSTQTHAISPLEGS